MTPEERHRTMRTDARSEETAGRVDPRTTGGHDEIILRAAAQAAREIRAGRRHRYARLGLQALFVMAVLALVLGASL